MIEFIRKNLKAAAFAGIPLFMLYFILRTFSQFEYFKLDPDQCTYLAIARTFPFHKLYNNDLFLIHQPLYCLIIGALSYVIPLFKAGLAVSIIFSILNFFLIRKMADMISLNKAGTLAALLYLSLNVPLIVTGSQVSRINILIFFIGMSIYYFQKYLLTMGKKYLARTLIFNSLSLLCSDQALLLLIAQCIQFIVHAKFSSTWKALLKIMVLSVLVYSIWPLIRLYFYMTNPHYPAGIDGTVEFFTRINLAEILQPNNLPLTKYYRSFYTSTSFSPANFNINKFLLVPTSIMFISKTYSIIVVSFLVLISSIFAVLRRDKAVLTLLLISFVLYYPCVVGMYFWYGLPFIVPFSLLIGKAVHYLTEKLALPDKGVMLSEIAIALILSALWMFGYCKSEINTPLQPSGGTHFLFLRKPITSGESSIKNLPDDKDAGYLAPIGIVNEAIYLSGKRFIALPYYYELLDVLIKEYKIKYIWFSGEMFRRFTEERGNFISGKDIVRRIASEPDKFEKVGEWREEYPDCYPPEVFFLYRVKSGETEH